MKIVIVARDPIGTGGGTVALETARNMQMRGHDIVFLSDYPVVSVLPSVNNPTTFFGEILRKWNPQMSLLLKIRHFLRLVLFSVAANFVLIGYRRNGYLVIDHNMEAFGGDVVVLHNVYFAQFLSDKRGFLRKIPQMLNPTFWFRIFRERIVLSSKSVKAVVAIAAEGLDEARFMFRSSILEKVIANGIDLQKFSPVNESEKQALRDEFAVDPNDFILLFVGHEFERKRLDLVLQALAKLDFPARLWIVGGRMSSNSFYVEMARNLGIEDKVVFWGTRNDTARFFQAADCFVLPSDYETWGMVTLEAMACGLPVVLTPVGCAPHIIRQGLNGFIVSSDATDIADAIIRIKSNKALAMSVALNARLEAEKHSWSNVTDAYLSLLEDLTVKELSCDR